MFDPVYLNNLVDYLEFECLSDNVSVTRYPCFPKANCLRTHMAHLEVWPLLVTATVSQTFLV